MSSAIQRADACVSLEGVSWEIYLRLRQLPENRNVRMTYDNGSLELMSPSKLHARIAELIGRFIASWTEDRSIPIQGCGTTTFHRQPKGLEPDKCYYVQHEQTTRHRDELDLSVDPPPDLVVEVDVTSPSRDRMPIYAALGVPEVWSWRDEVLRFLLLEEDGYVEHHESRSLPGFPRKIAERLLMERLSHDDTSLVVRFRTATRPGSE